MLPASIFPTQTAWQITISFAEVHYHYTKKITATSISDSAKYWKMIDVCCPLFTELTNEQPSSEPHGSHHYTGKSLCAGKGEKGTPSLKQSPPHPFEGSCPSAASKQPELRHTPNPQFHDEELLKRTRNRANRLHLTQQLGKHKNPKPQTPRASRTLVSMAL